MSRGQYTRGPAGRDFPADSEAEAAATAIAGLRRRLRRPGTLEHPAVKHELRMLEEQVFITVEATAHGKHAFPQPSAEARHDGEQIDDAFGFDLRPDPLAATTPEQFLRALWQYKVWSGDPSWRKMAARAGQRVVHSTMHAAMNGNTLPKLDVVKAIIIGCGGNDDDLRMFVTAWRRLESDRITGSSLGSDFLAAPVAALELVPTS
jgi:hypothetical protein